MDIKKKKYCYNFFLLTRKVLNYVAVTVRKSSESFYYITFPVLQQFLKLL